MKNLHLRPYKITSAQRLKESAEYCRWFRDVITANGEDIPAVIFCTNEVKVKLSL
jgi:hypothetical protein